MRGFNFERKDGKLADCAPCSFCKHRGKMTVEEPCYSCIDAIDLALHKANVETDFSHFEEESEDRLKELLELQNKTRG